jgi:hypothetical protein
MPFQADRFENETFVARRKRIPVPALAKWFDDGEEPVWEVRGLNSNELHRCLEAGQRQRSVESIVKAIAQTIDQATAVRKAIGLTTDTPGEIAKRMEMLTLGSVQPAVTLTTVVKLAETFPIEFLQLTNDISELTGKGFDLVKPEAASQPTTV